MAGFLEADPPSRFDVPPFDVYHASVQVVAEYVLDSSRHRSACFTSPNHDDSRDLTEVIDGHWRSRLRIGPWVK
jgi:hypothetical protein